MNSPYGSNVQNCQSVGSGPPLVSNKPTPEIEQTFSVLDSNCERLMKAVSALISRIHPICRPEGPTSPKEKNCDRANRLTPVAERIELFNDLINSQIAILRDATDRVEL
jgi:hypothetical protein